MTKNFLLFLHLIAIISWMAGILYLYRLIVYHVEETEAVVKERFKVMERRLLNFITRPAMVVSLLAGVGMILVDPSYYLKAGWLHAKLTLVLFLMLATEYAGGTCRRLRDNQPPRHSGRFYRILNEVPTLLMIGIVLLVVFKP